MHFFFHRLLLRSQLIIALSSFQLRLYGRQQNGISGLGRPDRGGVPGESDYQLGRHPVGESTRRAMGRATGARPHIPHGGTADHLFGVQGQYLFSQAAARGVFTYTQAAT